MGSEQSKEVEKGVYKALSEAQDVVLAYLFGSTAKGREHAFSDVDVAILLKDPSLDKVMRAHSLLTKLLGDKVDTLLLNFAPPIVKYRVVKDGLRVLARDEGARVSFEAKALSEGLDEGFSIRKVRQAIFRRLVG